MKKKVAFFSRVSTLEQHSSMDNQEKIFKQWLERNQDCTFHRLYEDEGISGAKGYKRTTWLEMLKDGEERKFDVIVCKSFSRFGRNQTETLSAVKNLRAKGVRCVFLEDNLDSEKDMSKFGLFAWLAEEEANKTSERIKMVWDSFNKEGKVHVAIAPYGYDYSKEINNFLVNEIEKEVVENMFNMYLQGYGFNKIAQMLTDNNVPTKKGGKWAGATVRKVLTNEFYIGTLIQGKTRTIDATMKENIIIDEDKWYKHSNHHEAIISDEVFIKVNNQILSRSNKAKEVYTKEHSNKKRNSNKSLFSNLLVCGLCGGGMTIKRKRKDNYKPFYQCIDYDKISLKCGHRSNRINEVDLIELVKEELEELSEDNFRELKNLQIMKKEDKTIEKMKKEIIAIEKKIEEQIKLANDLLKFYTTGKIVEMQFTLQNDNIQKALSELIKRKNILKEKIDNSENTQEEEKKIFMGIEGIVGKDTQEWSNAELKEVIENIIIYPDTIKLNIKYFNRF